MTLVSGNNTYPTTDEVLSLYQDIESACAAEDVTEERRDSLLADAAAAESREDLARVRQQLKEFTTHVE